MMIEAVAPPATTVRAPADEDRLYSVTQVAALLGVNRVTVWRWIRTGRLPASRFGSRTTRIARGDLERALTHAPPNGPRLRLVHETEVRPELAGGPMGEHIAQFYDEDGFLLNAVSDFIGTALRSGDSGVVIATEAHRVGLEERLQAAGLDLNTARGQGRYVALDAAETLALLMVDGMPDAGRFAELVGGIVTRAGHDGRRVSAFGEMVALLAESGNHAGAIRLEALWNELRQAQRFSLFCAYPMAVFDGQGYSGPFDAVCAEHGRVIPAEGYAALGEPDDRLREIARLQQKARSLEAEIAERERAEVALRSKQRELDDFVENATVSLHRVGPDGRILWANQAELELLGYTR
jgi:excisionase family DNA binding protein